MNIETRDDNVHTEMASDKWRYYTECGACFLRADVTATDRPLTCAECLRRLDKKENTTT